MYIFINMHLYTSAKKRVECIFVYRHVEIYNFLQFYTLSGHHIDKELLCTLMSRPYSLQTAPAATLTVSFDILKCIHKERQEALRCMEIFFLNSDCDILFFST